MNFDLFTGTILLLPIDYNPQDCLECDGSLLNIEQYPALHSLIGTKYGGDGIHNFMLPNLKASRPLPLMRYYIVVEGIYPHKSNN